MNITLKVTKQSASIVGEPAIDEVDFVLNFGHIIQGKSAYQQAVEAGYNGSEEEFMNRLAKAGSLIGTADVENGAITEEKLEPKYRESLASKSYVDSSRSTYTITSFTAIDIWNAFHSGTMGDLIFDDAEGATTLPEAVRGGKVVLLRANSESNALYVCNVEVFTPCIYITYIDFRGHIVRFCYDPHRVPYRVVVAIHAGNLPDGGSSRQVLTKTGEGIDDVEWQTPPTATHILPFTHEEVIKWTEVASENVGRIMDPAKVSEIDEAIKANKVVMIHTVDDYNVDGYYPCSAKVEDMVYINYLDNDGNVVAISFDISGTFDSADVKPIGLPAGGREDQVLSKYSDANQYAWIDLPTYTTIIQSFTAEDVKNAFHSGDESASDLMVSSFDISEIDKAMQEGKVILIRANEQSNSVYVCDAINEGGLVRITYRDTASHTVSFLFNPEDAEPYILIDRHTSSLPSGGEAGQVLTKTGEGIDDVEWQTPQGGAEGALVYNAPQTLTDEQKSQVAKNIGQPRERLILEWTNEEAEVLQPTAYDAETGYFTVESMPSWLAEDGAEAYGIINYADNVLCPAAWADAYGYISLKYIPLPSGNEGTMFYVERVSESQIVLYTTKDKDTRVTIPSGVRCDGFYLTNELYVALKIPTLTGNIKYRLTINRAALRPSMYRKVGVQGIVGASAGDHTDGGLGYQTKHHFETNSVYEFVVDFDNMKYIMTRIECNGQERTNTTGGTQAFINPTLYGLYWEDIGNLPNSPTYVYINIDKMYINKYTTIKLYEIIE